MSRLVMLLLLSLLIQPALAERFFSDAAKRGEWTSSQYPYVTISGKRYQLAPGVKVYDKDNRIIQPVMYPARASVAYHQDFGGTITKIWLLTTDEQRNFEKKKR